MKYLGIITLVLLFSFTPFKNELEIGKILPMSDTKMKSIDGSDVTFNSLKQENGLLVIFSCNTCPWVIKWQDRYNELHTLAKANKVGMVLVNSNEAYRSKDDSYEAMVKHAKENGYTMPYTVDKNHEIADAFGANRTPHVFLFNSNDKLVYRGAIDDNAKKAEVKKPYLKNALKALGGVGNISVETTKSIGCTIKRLGR
jgi:thioredoxin-related protein